VRRDLGSGQAEVLALGVARLIIGRRSLPALPRCFGSVTIRLVRPVMSSTCSLTVTPSMNSWNRTLPATSVTIGCVCGSQVAVMSPALTRSSSRAEMMAPYGTL
jgi:hypothetical protein